MKAEKNNENEDGDEDGADDGVAEDEGAAEDGDGSGSDDGGGTSGSGSAGDGTGNGDCPPGKTCKQDEYDECIARVNPVQRIDCTWDCSVCTCTCFYGPAPDQGTVIQADNSSNNSATQTHPEIDIEVEVETNVNCDKVWRAEYAAMVGGTVHIASSGPMDMTNVRDHVSYQFNENWGTAPNLSLDFVEAYREKRGGCETTTEAKKCPYGPDVYRKTRRCKGQERETTSACYVYVVGPDGKCTMKKTSSPDACSCKDAKEAKQ